MIKLIIWGIVIYLVYKFVFELVVPVSKATSQMKDTLQQMQQQQHSYQQQQQQPPTAATTTKPTTSSAKDDYIDFEEVK